MRCPAVALLLACLAYAAPEAGPPDPERVERLVRLLSHEHDGVRRRAFRQLAAMGDAVAPMLADLEVRDPEARRSVRSLTRSLRRMRLNLLEAPATTAFGEALEIVVELRNDSDDAYRLPLMINERRRGRVRSAFFLLDGARSTSIHELPVPARTNLPPGATMAVTIRFEPADFPFRKPGTHRLVVGYGAEAWRHAGDVRRGDAESLALETDTFAIECRSRTPRQLDEALRGGDAKKRAAAILELVLRDDRELLPVLRAHGGRAPEVEFRRHAIRRLGRHAAEEDLATLLDAVSDPDRKVIEAAIAGLGAYPGQRKARARLLVLTNHATFRGAAVKALRQHPHPAVVRRLIGILKRGRARPAVLKDAAATLTRWTGLPVTARRSEAEALERWWNDPTNRRRFAQRHGR